MNKREAIIKISTKKGDPVIKLRMEGCAISIDSLKRQKSFVDPSRPIWDVLGCRACPFIEEGIKELEENYSEKNLRLYNNSYEDKKITHVFCVTKNYNNGAKERPPCETETMVVANKDPMGRVTISDIE